jgi:hypothetical protein
MIGILLLVCACNQVSGADKFKYFEGDTDSAQDAADAQDAGDAGE